MKCNSSESIGRAIAQYGFYDLALSELCLRLLDRNDYCLDVGANIGYVSLLIAAAAPNGSVVSFEPHPAVFQNLQTNCQLNPALSARISPVQAAVGEKPGSAHLTLPEDFDLNQGTARLSNEPETHTQGIEVALVCLDEYCPKNTDIGLLKIDVEGHEAEVLQGASLLLAQTKIRDIIYEHNSRPEQNKIENMLGQYGYTCFDLVKQFRGVALQPISESPVNSAWEPTNRLATRDPERALERVHKPGWQLFRFKSEEWNHGEHS